LRDLKPKLEKFAVDLAAAMDRLEISHALRAVK
jgi:hypothetical protein